MGLGFDYHLLTDKFDVRRINANFQKLENIGLVNPNLLINGDFAINQTGIVSGQSYHAYQMFIDCWNIGYSGSTDNVIFTQGAGITLNSGSVLWQYLEMLYTDLFGKTFTVTFKKSDNTYHSATLAFPSSVNGATVSNSALIDGVGTVQLSFEYRSGGAVINGQTVNYVPMVFLTSNANQVLRRAKLEVGNTSTLFMDAPMDYGRGLQKCIRYYVNTAGGVSELKRVYNNTGSPYLLGVSCDFMVPMRIKPTITVSADDNYTGISTWDFTAITRYCFTVYKNIDNMHWLELHSYIADARL